MNRVSLVRIVPLGAIAALVVALVLVSTSEANTADAGAEPQGGPIGPVLIKGDNDCDADSDAVDALVALQHVAGFFYEQEPFCLTLGFPINPLGESEPSGILPVPWVFGDIDCDFDIDAVDALLILRALAGFSLNLPPPLLCPPFGAPY